MCPLVNAQMHIVYWGWNGNPALQYLASAIDECLKRLPNTHYYDGLAQYGCFAPGWIDSTIQPWDGPNPLDRSDIEDRLRLWFDASLLPDPKNGDPNLFFIIFAPPGTVLTQGGETSPTDFLGYHNSFLAIGGPAQFSNVIYAAMSWLGDPVPAANASQSAIRAYADKSIDRISPQLIHEIVEAVVDPVPPGLEIGDPCQKGRWVRMGPWLVEKYLSEADGRCIPSGWREWAPLRGPMNGVLGAFARNAGVCDVFAWNTDDRLWQLSWVNGTGWWPAWAPVDPQDKADANFKLLSGPAAASAGPNHVQVFAYGTKGGAGDPQMYSKWWVDSGGWARWTPIGIPSAGWLVGAPGAFFRQPGICDVFTHAADNRLWQASWVKGHPWTKWAPVDPQNKLDANFKLISAPAVASAGPNHVQIFAVGSKGGAGDPQLYSKWWGDPGSWSAWTPLGRPPTTQIMGAPGAFFRDPGICDVFVRGGDDRLWRISWVEGHPWTNWHLVEADPSGDPSVSPLLDPPDAAFALLGPPVVTCQPGLVNDVLYHIDQLQIFASGSKNGPAGAGLFAKEWTL